MNGVCYLIKKYKSVSMHHVGADFLFLGCKDA